MGLLGIVIVVAKIVRLTIAISNPTRADVIFPESAPVKRILLVDCDAFFVQVARLEDPQDTGKAPLLIAGGSPTGRGVVTSTSYEARAYGVPSSMPTAHALRLCHEAAVVGVPLGAVSAKSQ